MYLKKFGAFLLAGCLLCVGAQVLPEQNAVSITAHAEEIDEYGQGYEIITDSETGEKYAAIIGRKEKSAELIIPAAINASDGIIYPVTQVCGTGFLTSSAFGNDEVLERVVFGENLKVIGQEAFSKDTALKEIQFNEGLETIGAFAFSGCTSLESVTLPASLKSLKGSAFRENTNLKKVEFLGGNELVIDGMVFYKSGLETVIMGEGVKELSTDAFKDCTALTNIQLSPTLQTIGKQAFMRCTALEEIEIPVSVETIGENAFSNASNLKSIKLNEGLKTIKREAFTNTALEEITIPASVEEIGMLAFNKKIKICGYEGSAAQAYAEKNGFTFEALNAEPTAEILLGDADQNSEVDVLDVISINKAILGKENLSENGLKAIDFNHNGKPDSDEAMQVLKFIVGLIKEFNA